MEETMEESFIKADDKNDEASSFADYNGHEFAWTEKFVKAIPTKSHLRRGTANVLAQCLNHQNKFYKRANFKLGHRVLECFGLDRRYIKPYLEAFQQAGLLKYKIETGKYPEVTLLCFSKCPPNR